MFKTTRLAFAAIATLAATPVVAQDNVLSFSVTGGARVAPDYFGASGHGVSPAFGVGFQGLRFGDMQLGDPDGPRVLTPGAGLRGSFRFIGERDGVKELAGLNTVDAALELGLGVHYTSDIWQVFADLRYGVIGHKGITGELGANLIYRAPSGLVLNAGPRAEFGSSRFTNTYFGVTAAESGPPSGFAQHTASGGIYSVGVELGAYQPLGDDWGVTGMVRYDRLRGDAARSPITLQGSRDQVSAEIGLTRHFNLRF
ncbi:MAG: MipA/OmpV family protein [Alphaproteobacteria bacterium]|jgi:outer membrane scaffolding protein for murein synthesis (MipA/OmpV family)|nr:MipA/OmpV family protein [Alphaproteobacteria bacterium]